MNYVQDPRTRQGDLAAASFLTLTEGERKDVIDILRRLTGFDEDAVDPRNSRELRTRLAKLTYMGRLSELRTSKHPYMLSAFRRNAYVLGVLGVLMSDQAAAVDDAVAAILKERGE